MSGKLVRDRIVDILDAKGISTVSYRLTGQPLLYALQDKLTEEVGEYEHAATTAEITDELADILEVVYELGERHGIASSQLDRHRATKAAERGRFSEGIWLEGPQNAEKRV